LREEEQRRKAEAEALRGPRKKKSRGPSRDNTVGRKGAAGKSSKS